MSSECFELVVKGRLRPTLVVPGEDSLVLPEAGIARALISGALGTF
jgi:hypothetical protein